MTMGCSSGDENAGADASSDGQTADVGADAYDAGVDAVADAPADAAEEPFPDAGDSFDDSCALDAGNPCYLFTAPDIQRSPWMQCWGEHTTLAPHDMYGRCTFECRNVNYPKGNDPDYVKVCTSLGGECRPMVTGGADFCVPK